MSKKKALILVSDPQERQDWLKAIGQACGKRVAASSVESLGRLYASLKEESIDLILMSLDIPTTDGALETVDSLQLVWFLKRRYPALLSVVTARDSQHREACLKAGASGFCALESPSSMEQSAQEIRQLLGIAPEDPQDQAWWLRPEWVLTRPDGSLILARNCNDTEIRCDISDFLSLKARQLDQALLGEGWASVTVRAENAVLELFQIQEGQRALCIAEGPVVDEPLEAELIQQLRQLELYEDDHAVS